MKVLILIILIVCSALASQSQAPSTYKTSIKNANKVTVTGGTVNIAKVDTLLATSPVEQSRMLDALELHEAITGLQGANNDEMLVYFTDKIMAYYQRKKFSGFALDSSQMSIVQNIYVKRPYSYMTQQLLPVLFYQPDNFATSHIVQSIKDGREDSDYFTAAGRYINKLKSIENFIDPLARFIRRDTLNNWRTLLGFVDALSPKHFRTFINDRRLLNAIPKKDYALFIQNLGIYDQERKQIIADSPISIPH